MKTLHNPEPNFPKEEVRSAIRSGIYRANKKNIRKKKALIYTLSTVAAAVGLLFGSSYVSPVIANTFSKIVGSVFGESDQLRLQKAQENGVVTSIGETQTVNGISVTLDEILYDQNTVTVGLVIESEEELDDYYFGAGPDFLIDQERPSYFSGGYGETILSETKRTAIAEMDVREEMLDSFELGLILEGESGDTWFFSSPVDKVKDIQIISVDHTQYVEDLSLKVNDIELSKTGMSLTYTSFEDQTDFENSRGGYIEFKVVDQEGRTINGYSGGGSGELTKEGIRFTSRKQFDPLDNQVTALMITPYLSIPTSGGSTEIDKDGNEVVIEYEGAKVQPIEFKPFKVRLK